MSNTNSTMAQHIARAAGAFMRETTGHGASSVAVALNDSTLVVTLHDALSEAEKTLARSPAGAAQVQEFHRQLFAAAGPALRQEIARITGVEVCDAAAEVAPASGSVVQVFTTGTMVQVFLLAGNVPEGTWKGNEPRAPHCVPGAIRHEE